MLKSIRFCCVIAGVILSCLSFAFASDVIYVIANPTGPNYVTAYTRNQQSGALTLLGSYPTGGAGLVSTEFVGAQANSLVFSKGRLYAINPGSNDISIFSVQEDGTLRLAHAPIPSGGIGPETIAIHDHLLYVGNDGNASTPPNMTGFLIDNGSLRPIHGSAVTLNIGDHPADLKFSKNGHFLVGSLADSGIIDVFRVKDDGTLLQTAELHDQPGIVELAFNPVHQNKLIGTLANFPGVKSYVISAEGEITILSSIQDTATIDSCWIVTDKAGTKAWVTAPLSSSIILYTIDPQTRLTRVSSHDTSSFGFTLTDLVMDESGSFIYAMKPLSGSVHIFRLTGSELEAGVADAGDVIVPAPPGGVPYAPLGIVLVQTGNDSHGDD
ncbi:MAG: lactonase family protein [Acidobacteriia bacterium]|nr:lactonase family protein [Terriglobia bacterium]